MKSKRLARYLSRKNSTAADPIKKKDEVNRHADQKIDQDFPGFPHGQATEKMISPKTKTEKKTAAVDVKDGEKRYTSGKPNRDEQASDGSGGAFDATESVNE